MCEAFFLAEFTKNPTGWTHESPGFWGIRIQQTQWFTKFTNIEFQLQKQKIINQGQLAPVASLVSWIRSEFTLIPNCPLPPLHQLSLFYISSVWFWLFDSIFSLRGILTIPTTLPEIWKLYNIHLLKHIISRGFRWLMIESSCWPSPCCSFARHLVGKIVIHCSSAHHYAQPCKKKLSLPWTAMVRVRRLMPKHGMVQPLQSSQVPKTFSDEDVFVVFVQRGPLD